MTGFLNLTVQEIVAVFRSAAMPFLPVLLNDRELVGEHLNMPLGCVVDRGVMVLVIVYNGLCSISTMFPNAL